ncbi:MAG: DUF3644 domain-containing protein [Candidatus Hatepunaea meridiana]|nr:DUF3644 domain-containing protein [Candidatus Hatepunaea meridiana]
MNYRGSYRRLLGNAKAAMLAAIEIYNKPRFEYRDECFVFLLINAWELVLKGVLSKNKQSIYYQKRRNEPYKTLSLKDAFNKAERFFQECLSSLPLRKNIELLTIYRDNVVHFYNEKEFGKMIYALAQTSIVNFKDLVQNVFAQDIGEEITWSLLPLGMSPPIDPIQYIKAKASEINRRNSAVSQFLTELQKAVEEVEDAGLDTGRLLTIFTVNLQSTKKISKADIIVGIRGNDTQDEPLIVTKLVDPNVTHTLRQKNITNQIDNLHGINFTSHTFQAILWKYNLKEKRQYCWKDSEGSLTKYSNDIITFIKRLNQNDIETVMHEYRTYRRLKRKQSKAK